jgi:hypothetical protein
MYWAAAGRRNLYQSVSDEERYVIDSYRLHLLTKLTNSMELSTTREATSREATR